MTHGLNQEQLSHLKSLDSKKKKRKFLLDCMLENIDLEISNFFSKDYVKSENVENVGKSIVFINGMYETSNKKEIELLDSLHPMILRKIDESNYIDNENHLCWIFNRLIHRGENPNLDYMIRLKEIALNYSEPKPKQETEEKVDLSKELYLTYDNGEKKSSAVRVLDYENGFGFGFIDGSYFDYSENRINYNFRFKDGFWRKSTALEVTNMLIDKLKLDGFYVGCNIDNTSILDNGRVYVTKENYFLYKDFDMLLCGSVIIYNNGKFATIIPQEEVKIKTEQGDAVAKEEEAVKLTLNDGTVIWKTKWDILQEPKAENHELVNSSDEIKDIIVVDFENVSQKENPQ